MNSWSLWDNLLSTNFLLVHLISDVVVVIVIVVIIVVKPK